MYLSFGTWMFARVHVPDSIERAKTNVPDIYPSVAAAAAAGSMPRRAVLIVTRYKTQRETKAREITRAFRD